MVGIKKPPPEEKRCEYIFPDGSRCKATKIDGRYCFWHSPQFEELRRKGREKAHRTRISKVAMISFECDSCQIDSCKKRQPGAKCFYVSPFRNIDLDDPEEIKRIFTDLVALEMGSIHFYKLMEKLTRKPFQREVSRAVHRLSQILESYHSITKGTQVTVNVKKEQEIEQIKTLADLFLAEQKAQTWDEKLKIREQIKKYLEK
jgi:hypothetical protein